MSEKDKLEDYPAFPVISESFGHYSGMTLRDYFAGQAVGNLYADYMTEGSFSPTDYSDIAKAAYRIAEAMLRERERMNDE